MRSFPSAAGTWIAVVPELTANDWPVRAFSGVLTDGEVKRGSRQVPVHSTGSVGASKCVSLYATSVRLAAFVPSMLGSQRVFQKPSLPVKKARLTPASRAACRFARCEADQYSSWPLEMNSLWLRSSDGLLATSTLET